MRLVHYSIHPGLTTIDPAKIGTSGVKGNSFRSGLPKIGVSYFYREGTEPEHVVTSRGRHKYLTQLTPEQKLYDLGPDSEGIISKALEAAGGSFWHPMDYHKALIDAGYHGYYNTESDLPNAVALFHPQAVKQIVKDPKGHRNTKFGDEHFAEFNTTPEETTMEELVQIIVTKLLG